MTISLPVSVILLGLSLYNYVIDKIKIISQMNIYTISKILSTQGTILNKGEDELLLNKLTCLNINEIIRTIIASRK